MQCKYFYKRQYTKSIQIKIIKKMNQNKLSNFVQKNTFKMKMIKKNIQSFKEKNRKIKFNYKNNIQKIN